MDFSLPEPDDVLARMSGVRALMDGIERSIEEWREIYKRDLASNRGKPHITIFNQFVNNLLERAMLGEAFSKRAHAFERVFVGYDAVTDGNAQEALKESGYRWGPVKGTAVIVAAKGIATANGFTWQDYVRRAEDDYKNDYQDDAFLEIANVSEDVPFVVEGR